MRLGISIKDATEYPSGLTLIQVDENCLCSAETTIDELLERAGTINAPTLWLVIDEAHRHHLDGVLSPFELM
jgi:hypothetical protein